MAACSDLEPFALVVLHKLADEIALYAVHDGTRLASAATGRFPHELCLDPRRRSVFVSEYGARGVETASRGGNTVGLYSLPTLARTRTISTGEFVRPHGIVADANGRLLVTAESDGVLLVFDRETGDRVHAVDTTQLLPHLAAVSPDGHTAYTANLGSGTVTEIDVMSGGVRAQIPVLTRPEGMVFSPDGVFLYVANRESGAVAIVDTRRREVNGTIRTGDGPVRLAITPDGRQLAVPLFHANAVQVADTMTREVTATIAVGRQPAGTTMSPDGRFLFVSCEHECRVHVVSMLTCSVVGTIDTGLGPDAMACLWRHEMADAHE